MAWRSIRQVLSQHSKHELIGLLADLYRLDKGNEQFLETRFRQGLEDLSEYKKIIQQNVCPDLNKPLRLSIARKAISEFKKATGNTASLLELMIYYVEQGVKFTLMYGDIDEPFYSSIESMFTSAIKILYKEVKLQEEFLHRLQQIVYDTRDIGWGFHDYLSETLNDYFPQRN